MPTQFIYSSFHLFIVLAISRVNCVQHKKDDLALTSLEVKVKPSKKIMVFEQRLIHISHQVVQVHEVKWQQKAGQVGQQSQPSWWYFDHKRGQG